MCGRYTYVGYIAVTKGRVIPGMSPARVAGSALRNSEAAPRSHLRGRRIFSIDTRVLAVRAAHALTDAFEGVDCDQDALLGQVGSDQIAHDQIAADIAARVS